MRLRLIQKLLINVFVKLVNAQNQCKRHNRGLHLVWSRNLNIALIKP